MFEKYDFIIVGGGIVGLTTSYCLRGNRVLVLDKEPDVALHQSGRNSGVVHSGIYYKPNSMKAKTCRLGKELLEAFCYSRNIAFQKCGKVIIATNKKEINRLEEILDRGKKNGVECDIINSNKLHSLEPYVRGIQAIHVPETGIVNYRVVCHALSQYVETQTYQKVHCIIQSSNEVEVHTNNNIFKATYVINCAGINAVDLMEQSSGKKVNFKLMPFRGEYYTLKSEARYLCNSLIYPVPDPEMPFLGVHFTKTIGGGVECGPNAVLAFGKESQNIWDINWQELAIILSYSGFQKLAIKHWKTVLKEMRMSLFKSFYLKELQRLIPSIKQSDLVPRYPGIRAQAVDEQGNLIDDFRLERDKNILHVLNAPSPAATAAFAIGKHIKEMI
jgi:L-2-hydroxyglutarate oxidase